jgi:hypothetical protein
VVAKTARVKEEVLLRKDRICSSPHCERGLGCATRRH